MKFNWEAFTENDLKQLNAMESYPEDDIYGDILLESADGDYIIDIHYEYYSSKERGFDLEVYQGFKDDNFGWTHGLWFGSIHDIKSATDYKRFKNRAEKLITEFIKEECK